MFVVTDPSISLPIITVRNEVAKVMFLHVSVILCTGGGAIPACIAGGIPACLAAGLRGCVLSQHAFQVVSQHAFQQVSRGVPGPGGCLLGGVWPSGVVAF